MTKRNRDTLKRRFGEGEMPSAGDFSDLIESVLNIHDDGIAHNERDGLRLTQIGGNSRVLSLYGAVEEESTAWAFGLDGRTARLTLDAARRGAPSAGVDADDEAEGGGYAVLTLLGPDGDGRTDGRIGVNTRHPRHQLDVDGVVASSGRVGAVGSRPAPADAEWHTIGGPYQGCTALEVTAGAGRRDSGKYALMHAFALRAFDAKGEITYHQAHYGSRRHRLQLRWVDDKAVPGNYYLQLRVGCAYGENTRIQYHLTSLWLDPRMDGSIAPEEA